MSFDWSEYLDLAHELANVPPTKFAGTEAHLRTALSRTYYAAYKIALHTAQSKDQYNSPLSGSMHTDLIDHFHASNDLVRKDIANDLRRLLRYRRSADYDDFYAMDALERHTITALQLATHLIDKLNRL